MDNLHKRLQERQKNDRIGLNRASKMVLRLIKQDVPPDEIRNAVALHSALADDFNTKYNIYNDYRRV